MDHVLTTAVPIQRHRMRSNRFSSSPFRARRPTMSGSLGAAEARLICIALAEARRFAAVRYTSGTSFATILLATEVHLK